MISHVIEESIWALVVRTRVARSVSHDRLCQKPYWAELKELRTQDGAGATC